MTDGKRIRTGRAGLVHLIHPKHNAWTICEQPDTPQQTPMYDTFDHLYVDDPPDCLACLALLPRVAFSV